mgnify:CR=1 FL=1
MVLSTTATAIAAVLTPLAMALDKLTNVLNESMQFGDKTQKASLALGLDLTKVRARLGPSIDGLRGAIQHQFATGIMGLEAGLKGNTLGVNKLVNQQMLTGTAFEKTHKVFARLQAVGGLNIRALNALGDQTRILGATYGVKTDVLVNALNSLSQLMPTLGMLGMTEGMAGAMVSLRCNGDARGTLADGDVW